VTDAVANLMAFQLEPDLAAAVNEIRTDASSGPIELARRGVEVVFRLTEKAHYERPLHINLEAQGLARALLATRPECMPLAHLACETIRPLPTFYGRGREEGTRMRGDLRARIQAWLDALNARAARIDAARATLRTGGSTVVTAQALDQTWVYVREVPDARPRLAVAGVEKFVPTNYAFSAVGLERAPLEEWDGFLTGDSDGPASTESVRSAIAALRFEPTLL
jgi:hypothetical protein